MKYQGALTISKYQGGQRGSGVTVSLRDNLSKCEIIDIDISVEEFAQALFGLGDRPCEFEARVKNLGKTRETKSERIKPPEIKDYKRSKEIAAKALKPYEIDGWYGDEDDLLNHHRCNPDGTHTVGFVRWV